MSDIKWVIGVVGVSVALVLVAIFGLTKMGGNSSGLKTEVATLVQGASLVRKNGNGRVSVVVFSDMECPACLRANSLMAEIEERDDVTFVFRHYPLSIHKNAVAAAMAVETANRMGVGFLYKDLMFEKQSEWSGVDKPLEKFVGYAMSLGLEKEKFEATYREAGVSEAVKRDTLLGDSLRLSGTPTVFVDGEQVGVDFVGAKIDQLLSKNGD